MGLKHIELLVVFTISLNLFAGMLIQGGIAAHLGMGGQMDVGGDQAREQAVDNATSVDSGAPTGSTLFGMYNVLSDTIANFRIIAFAAPTMLYNLGTPEFITDPLYALITIIYGFGLIRFFRGI